MLQRTTAEKQRDTKLYVGKYKNKFLIIQKECIRIINCVCTFTAK